MKMDNSRPIESLLNNGTWKKEEHSCWRQASRCLISDGKALPTVCHCVLGTKQALWSSAKHLKWFLPWGHGGVPLQPTLVSLCRLALQISAHTGVRSHVLDHSEQQT